jgi:hypothetical protein
MDGMAFDSGPKWASAMVVLCTWLYGLCVFGAFKLVGRSPMAILIPFISIGGVFLFDFLARLSSYH